VCGAERVEAIVRGTPVEEYERRLRAKRIAERWPRARIRRAPSGGA
jgi:hypothetical protein